MRWANFLHIYQPAEQVPDILHAVVVQSYRPILEGIKKNPQVKLTLNITGALIELFDKYKYHDLIDSLREVGKSGQVEFTGSAKYHAFLPFLSDEDITHQIKINDQTNKFFLGDAYKPKGFFPPEMGYRENIAPIIESLGFKWILLDEIAFCGEPEKVDYTKNYKIKNTNLNVYFRERRLSNLIMSAVVRSEETLKEAMKGDLKSDRYILTAMDGETFGHHRPGLEKLLFQIFAAKDFDLIQISDIPTYYKETIEISPIASTWASSKADIDKGIQFLSWFDPENIIHAWQRELVSLVTTEINQADKNAKGYLVSRKKMDIALASDHFWWASAKPWWSVEMIEDGAYRLLDTLRSIPNVAPKTLQKASLLYENIVSTSFNWQRSGKIREMMSEQGSLTRIPFLERTLDKGGNEASIYYAFMDMLSQLEKKASASGEYEKAIMWRDAIYKFENKHDIYDAINAIDLLRLEIPHKEVEETLDRYTEKYRSIRGGQPEQRGS